MPSSERDAGAAPAGIGLRAKTGRAIAVVLVGDAAAPRVHRRTTLSLIDPALPVTAQPYHAVMTLPWPEAERAAAPAATRIELIASDALARLLRELELAGILARGVGVVGAGDRSLERIGNPHVRAHAAEGLLFRRVLETAAHANRVALRTIPAGALARVAAADLRIAPAAFTQRLAALGRRVGPPWRADEKAAATAAWLALAT